MINPVKELTSYDGDEWQEYLDKICLYDIFKELIEKYNDQPTLVKCLIRYIVWTYSKDSEKIILGGDWLENKKRIYEAADLPPTTILHSDVLHLKCRVILVTIKSWISFQDNDTFTELKMLEDLRVEMQLSANSPILKSTGEVDYDAKFKCAKYSIELYQMIKDAEQKLLQNDPRMKESVQEVKKATKIRNTIGPESFAK